MKSVIKTLRNWRGLAVYKVRFADRPQPVYLEASSPQEARRFAAFIYRAAPLSVAKAED